MSADGILSFQLAARIKLQYSIRDFAGPISPEPPLNPPLKITLLTRSTRASKTYLPASTTQARGGGLLQGAAPSDDECLIFPAHHTHLATRTNCDVAALGTATYHIISYIPNHISYKYRVSLSCIPAYAIWNLSKDLATKKRWKTLPWWLTLTAELNSQCTVKFVSLQPGNSRWCMERILPTSTPWMLWKYPASSGLTCWWNWCLVTSGKAQYSKAVGCNMLQHREPIWALFDWG